MSWTGDNYSPSLQEYIDSTGSTSDWFELSNFYPHSGLLASGEEAKLGGQFARAPGGFEREHPEWKVITSSGATAGRMDPYVDLFQSHGGSMVMIAKGNRSAAVTEACKKHGGFYLGSIGGPAALLAKENIKKVELLEYPELGMEAIYRIEVEDFPAFILVDDKGNDFFRELG